MNSTKAEQELEKRLYDKSNTWELIFDIKNVLNTCQRLRRKTAVLNRRLQRTRTENKYLRKKIKELRTQIIDIERNYFLDKST